MSFKKARVVLVNTNRFSQEELDELNEGRVGHESQVDNRVVVFRRGILPSATAILREAVKGVGDSISGKVTIPEASTLTETPHTITGPAEPRETIGSSIVAFTASVPDSLK